MLFIIAQCFVFSNLDGLSNWKEYNWAPVFLKKIMATIDHPVWIEVVCFICGFSLLWVEQSLCPLRVFRVIRFVWYATLYNEQDYVTNKMLALCISCFKLVKVYLEKISTELFTQRCNGAILLLSLFFYFSYVTGVIFWSVTEFWQLPSSAGVCTLK